VVNDVKYLCEQLLDDAPPPLRDGAEVLALARRSTARRSAVQATGGALAVAALTGAAVLVAPAIAATTTATTVQLAAPKASEPPSPAPVPYAQASGAHETKMFETMKHALPAGFTAAPESPLSTDPTPYPTDPTVPRSPGSGATIAASVGVLVSNDGRVGWLSADIFNDGRPLPTGDLCGPDVAKRTGTQPGTTCTVIDVNGTQIRITREHWDNTAPEIDVIVATRFLRNGSVSIVESRSVPDFQSEKDPLPPDAKNKHPKKQTPTSALGDWFLTDQQLAELIAGPGMLP
jgi:hypothetical protein